MFDFHQAIDGLNEAKLGDAKLGECENRNGSCRLVIVLDKGNLVYEERKIILGKINVIHEKSDRKGRI